MWRNYTNSEFLRDFGLKNPNFDVRARYPALPNSPTPKIRVKQVQYSIWVSKEQIARLQARPEIAMVASVQGANQEALFFSMPWIWVYDIP